MKHPSAVLPVPRQAARPWSSLAESPPLRTTSICCMRQLYTFVKGHTASGMRACPGKLCEHKCLLERHLHVATTCLIVPATEVFAIYPLHGSTALHATARSGVRLLLLGSLRARHA